MGMEGQWHYMLHAIGELLWHSTVSKGLKPSLQTAICEVGKRELLSVPANAHGEAVGGWKSIGGGGLVNIKH